MVDEEALLKEVQSVCRDARQKALDSGKSVIETSDGWLVERFPDGAILRIKKLPDPTHVPKGTIIKVKQIKQGLD